MKGKTMRMSAMIQSQDANVFFETNEFRTMESLEELADAISKLYQTHPQEELNRETSIRFKASVSEK